MNKKLAHRSKRNETQTHDYNNQFAEQYESEQF